MTLDFPMTVLRFVLEPIYKIFAHCLGEEKEDLAQTLAEAVKSTWYVV